MVSYSETRSPCSCRLDCAADIPPGLEEQFQALRRDSAPQPPASKTEEIVQKVPFAFARTCVIVCALPQSQAG